MAISITPFLCFTNTLEEAMDFYAGIFKNVIISNVSRYGEGAPEPAGTVLAAEFSIDGQNFIGLNGGNSFKFSEAISFMIHCEDQTEVDYYWNNLTAGGEESMCGWLKDKFGLSWQVVPNVLGSLLGSPDPVAAGRAMRAMMEMRKLDIAVLQAAHDGN